MKYGRKIINCLLLISEVDIRIECYRCEDLGNKLIEAEHPNSDSIKDKLAELVEEKAALFALWETRKLMYSQCIEYQLFCRDVEQTEAWLAKQEVNLSPDRF